MIYRAQGQGIQRRRITLVDFMYSLILTFNDTAGERGNAPS